MPSGTDIGKRLGEGHTSGQLKNTQQDLRVAVWAILNALPSRIKSFDSSSPDEEDRQLINQAKQLRGVCLIPSADYARGADN